VVGTVLKGDLQSTIEDQLQQYASGLTSTAGRAASAVGDTWEDLQRAGRTSVQDVQAQLSDYATQAYNAAQEQQRQAAQQAAEQAAEQAAAVQQHLTDYATQVSQAGQQQPVAGAPQQQQVAGAPAALPHSEEPGTATDIAGGSDLAKNWKTQFDFGATYTGDYRTGTPHRGVDLVPSSGRGIGTEVDAFTPGTVTNIFRDSGAGGLIVYVQDADGLTHAYMHLAGTQPGLAVGQHVDRGTPIAMMGESGTEGSPHLHYEVRKNAGSGDPLNQLIDPRPYLAGSKQPTGGVAGAVSTGATSLGTNVNRGVQQVTGQALPESAFEWKVNAGQSLSRDQVIAAGQQVGLSPEDAAYLYDSGVRNNIDAGSALAIIKLEGNARNPNNNNIFDISNAAYGGRPVPGSRWGQYDSKQQGIDAYYQLLNQEYIPRGQDTIGTIMHGPGSSPTTSTSHAYAPVSENRPSYPQEVADQVKAWGGQAFNAAQGAVGGAVAGARRTAGDVIQAGEQIAGAKPVIYNTPSGGSPMDQLQTIQSQLDALRNQLAGAPEAARQRVTEAAEPIVAGAQERIGAAFGGARQAVEDVAGGVQQANERLRQAVGANEPQYINLEPSPGGGKVLGVGPEPPAAGSIAAQVQSGQRDVRDLSPAEGAQYTAQLYGVGLPALVPTYRALAEAKRKAIEENNPLRDVVFAGGLSSMLVDAVADPITWVLPWGRVANLATSAAARAGAGPIVSRISGEAAMNGLQNAVFEMAQPTSDPASVGVAFLQGAGFGGVVRGAQETPVARAIGEAIRDQRGRGWPALEQLLRTRQRGEVDLGLITTGEPTPREGAIPPRPPDQIVEPLMIGGTTREPSPPPERPVAGVQRLPSYQPAGAPEAGFEAIARASREAQPDGRARIDLNTVPKDILPFTTDPAEAQQEGMVKLNPGGMPHTDDLRALWEANQHKRSFYTDQGDEAANIVGPNNTGEFFTLNSINSILTRVNSQVAESIQAAGLVRKVAREGRRQNLDDATIKQNILDALADKTQNPITGKAVNQKRASQLQAYTTGDASVSSGAKTSSFAGNYTSAEGRFFDPRITSDLHNWRLFNVSADEIPSLRKNQRTGEMEWMIDRPHESNVASNDRAYRGVESVIGELAREYGIDGYAMQSGLWDGMRSIQRDPEVLRLWQQGHFRDAIEMGKQRDLFRQVSPDMEFSGDVKSVMDSMPVKRALAQYGQYLKDDLPRELGLTTIERTFKGKRLGRSSKTSPAAKPSNLAFREQERPYAEAGAPIVQGLDEATVTRLGYDPQRGIFPWLEASHRVVPLGPDEYGVHLPAGNEDTARYVAAQVGQAANAERVQIHVPDYREGQVIGVGARGTPDQIGALQRELDAKGITNIVGTGKRSLQVPLERVGDQQTLDAVQDAAISIGFPEEQVGTYNGRHSDVPRADYAATSEQLAPTFAPTSPVRSDLLQRGLGAVPAERPPPGAIERFIRGESGQATLPGASNIAAAGLGGYAASAATPSDASPEERLRNIAAGAATGFAAGRLITRLPLRGAPERVGGAREPFRAPTRPETPELRATTQEPPGGPPGREPPPPRTLGEVRSNQYALREAAPGETPMTPDEMLSYGDELEQRLADVLSRRDAVDEMLRNPNQKVERPPWAAGLTNLQVAELARRADISPYEPLWWEKVGMEAGSGEVREALREGGAFAATQARKTDTPAQLRAEKARLDQEEANIYAAGEQLSNAPAEPNLVRVRTSEAAQGRPDLPFDTGAPSEPEPASVAEAGGGLDEGARLAQEIVLSKNRGTLGSRPGEVSLRDVDVGGTALVSHEAVQRITATPPSARTEANMPNLDAMLKDEPVIAAQIRKAAEDHPDLMEAYRQGRISMDSLRNDLAKRVGMTVQDWNKTKIGQGFNEREMMALQAAAVEQQGRAEDLARDILARGGVNDLSPEELVFSAATLADATKILAVARGGRSTAGRTLNALKQQFDRTMASGIALANEQLAARRLGEQARRAARRATAVLAKGRELEREATTAKATASRSGAPRNIIDQIAQAYDELDRYNAMTLHEKGAEFDRLKAERAKRAEARKANVRGAPEELLSALRAELKAEQDNFAKRKDTWETMAFWDSKAFENAMSKRTAFRGQLYIEQQRKLANIAAKDAEKTAAREFNATLQEGQRQRAKAERLLESIGGKEVTRDILDNFVKAMADPTPDAAAKFLKGMAKQNNWARANIIRVAGLVSGPLTNMVNIGGNVGNAMLEVPTRALVVGIDAFRSAITGGERQAYKAELLPMMQAYGPGMYGSLPNVVRALKTGINPNEAADLSKVRAGFASGNAVVDAAAEMPLRLLTAEDIAFRSAAVSAHSQRVGMREATHEGFRGEAAKGRAASIVQNLEEYPELAKEVSDAAARMVFQERRALPLPGQLPQGTKAVQEAGRLAVSQVSPFIRTPTNITAQGIAMTPIGFGGALEAARGVREMPSGTRTERYARGRQVLLAEERAARAVIGTTILGAGVALGYAGLMTAAYPEDEQARSALPQGWRPWSVKVTSPVDKNTYYVPLQNFGAAGVPLAIAAIATDPVHRGKTLLSPEEWGLAVTGIGKYVLDNTFLQGLSDFVDALQDPAARGGKFAESLVASYGPYSGLARESQRAFGVAARNPHAGMIGLVEAMEANYPGLSGNVPPSRMPLGDERVQGATGASRLLPLRFDIEKDEPTLKILRTAGVGIPKPPKAISLSGGSVPLTEDEQAQLQVMRGQAIRDMVPRVTQNPAAVQKAVDLATESATRAFVAQLGADEVRKRWNPKQAPEPYYLGTAAS
jgi:murein DD-endopeptidase MepM/ murein hydrolase activator NlpD